MQQHADSTLTHPKQQWISHESRHRSKPYTAFSPPSTVPTSSKPITAFSHSKPHSRSTKHHKSRSKRPREPLTNYSNLPPLPPPNYPPPPPPPPPADTLLAGIWQDPRQPAADPSATHASATSTADRASSPSPGTTSDASSLHVEVKTEYDETRPRDSSPHIEIPEVSHDAEDWSNVVRSALRDPSRTSLWLENL